VVTLADQGYGLIRALSPSRVAGEITLVHDPINQVTAVRDAWQYIPGQASAAVFLRAQIAKTSRRSWTNWRG